MKPLFEKLNEVAQVVFDSLSRYLRELIYIGRLHQWKGRVVKKNQNNLICNQKNDTCKRLIIIMPSRE